MSKARTRRRYLRAARYHLLSAPGQTWRPWYERVPPSLIRWYTRVYLMDGKVWIP
jgi:hypothetical protein